MDGYCRENTCDGKRKEKRKGSSKARRCQMMDNRGGEKEKEKTKRIQGRAMPDGWITVGGIVWGGGGKGSKAGRYQMDG